MMTVENESAAASTPIFSSPTEILQAKESLLAAWAQLPVDHQATMVLVLVQELQQSEWGAWVQEAIATTWPQEPSTAVLPFPVISLDRTTLRRAFSAAEVARLTDEQIAHIAEEMGIGFQLDPGFWYVVEMIGSRLLEEKAAAELVPLLPTDFTDNEADFAAWMQAVDRAVWQLAGCSIHDLPDCNFRPLFNDGLTPLEMAQEALQDAGFVFPDADEMWMDL